MTLIGSNDVSIRVTASTVAEPGTHDKLHPIKEDEILADRAEPGQWHKGGIIAKVNIVLTFHLAGHLSGAIDNVRCH